MDNEEIRIKMIKILPFLLIIVIAIIIGIFVYMNSSKEYIIFGNYLIYQKNGNNYKQIYNINDDILNEKFIVSDGKTEKKDVELVFTNNRFYIYNKKDIYVNMPKFRVATNGEKINLATYQQKSINNVNNDEYIKKYLNEQQESNNSTYTGYSTLYDFDKDGKDEIIYTINNYSLSKTTYEQKGFLFVIKNNKIIYDSSVSSSEPYTVMEIADLNNDNNYEIIINKGSRDLKTFDSCYQIYTLKKDKLKLIHDCN